MYCKKIKVYVFVYDNLKFKSVCENQHGSNIKESVRCSEILQIIKTNINLYHV